VLAQLNHPNIARLLDAGTTEDGTPYFTMEYVRGIPINKYCYDHLPTVEERVMLMLQVAKAIGYAHQNLVIHRDIKPSNILVDSAGIAKLVDFGIAKLASGDQGAALTRAQFGPMTPEYAAPEQFRSEPITVATDIYQFGVLLFVVLTGSLPYKPSPADPLAWANSVTRSPAMFLSKAFARNSRENAGQYWRMDNAKRIARRLSGDLDAIVDKALSKNPAQRYASMDAFADDLERFLSGRVVHARKPTRLYRVSRFVGRHRLATAATVVATLALTITAAVAVHQASVATIEAHAARENERSAEAARRFIEGIFLQADPWKNDGAPPDALELADRAFENLDHALADQPLARADLYWSLARVYHVAGSRERAIQAGERAVALYDELPVGLDRKFDAIMRLVLSYAYNGDLRAAGATIQKATALTGLSDFQRSRIAYALASVYRDQGRYDLMLSLHQEGIRLNREGAPVSGDYTALAQAFRVLRNYREAARNFLIAHEVGTYADSRGARAYLAIHELTWLPPEFRRDDDLELARQLEAERAAVWPGGTWKVQFSAFTAMLQLQHGQSAAAADTARALRLTSDRDPIDIGGYDAEFWLALTYILLNYAPDESTAEPFDLLVAALTKYSSSSDPRMLLAKAGRDCAKTGDVGPQVAADLANPPQPDYHGYEWLRDSPCAALKNSAAATYRPPEQYGLAAELRASLRVAQESFGVCANGNRVAVGASCDLE
jgi:hypothetical protein